MRCSKCMTMSWQHCKGFSKEQLQGTSLQRQMEPTRASSQWRYVFFSVAGRLPASCQLPVQLVEETVVSVCKVN